MEKKRKGSGPDAEGAPLQMRQADVVYEDSLRELGERLQRAMRPVEPSAAFVRSLGRELVEAARRRQAATRRLRRGLLIGAAALGSAASVAGVTLLLLRRRAPKASEA